MGTPWTPLPSQAHGLASLALNFRGCSGEMNRLPRLYHSGETTDLGLVIDRLRAEQAGRPLALVGFSLGGNVVTKYLGERGAAVADAIRAAAVISVPFDLSGCCDAIDGAGALALGFKRVRVRCGAERNPGVLTQEVAYRLASLPVTAADGSPRRGPPG